MKNIAENIKELRKEKMLRQEDLAYELGLDRSIISRWENGRAVPTMEQAVKLGEFFEVSSDTFFNEKNKTDKQKSRKNSLEEIRRMIIVIVLGIICYLFSPFTFPLCIYTIYYSFKKKMPIYIKVFSILVTYYCFGGFLHIFGVYITPVIVTVR